MVVADSLDCEKEMPYLDYLTNLHQISWECYDFVQEHFLDVEEAKTPNFKMAADDIYLISGSDMPFDVPFLTIGPIVSKNWSKF